MHDAATRELTQEAAQVLVQVHRLLWQATNEAFAAVANRRDPRAAHLAMSCSRLVDLVHELVPPSHLEELADRPEAVGADPVELVRLAEALTRTMPVDRFPVGMSEVVVLMIDTVRDFS